MSEVNEYRLDPSVELMHPSLLNTDRRDMFWAFVHLASTQIRSVADFDKWADAADLIFGKEFRYTDEGIGGGIDQIDDDFESALFSGIYKQRFGSYADCAPEFAEHARAMCKAAGQWDDDEARFNEEMSETA